MPDGWPHTLLHPAVFPDPVKELRLVETHISWVVLTGNFVYKIKKPVNLGFLDFSTLEKRRHFCRRELELNRRFSEELYLDVVPITGSLDSPLIGGEGNIIDYAVKMRQFDNRYLADHLAKNGLLQATDIDAIAETLAGFHDSLPAIHRDSPHGSAKQLYADAMENVTQIAAYPLPTATRQTLEELEQWTQENYQRCQPLLQQRRREGYVKDCHGDCHLGNIVMIEGRATLFDCIEFNDSFRVRDTIAEAAFLSMDLCARGLQERSLRFLNSYLEHSGDYRALPLLDLLRCYFAVVRAKVDLLRAPAKGHSDISPSTHPDFFHYLELARSFTYQKSPIIVLMHGLSGSGKSWLAERLAEKTAAIRIRSDVERKRLFGANHHATVGLYSEQASQRTFEYLNDLSQVVINAGFNCIVDATFLKQAVRAPFITSATRLRVPLAILHCQARESTILQRLQKRRAEGSDPSDADIQVYQAQKSKADGFTSEEKAWLIEIDTEEEGCVNLAVTQINKRSSSPPQ